MKTSKDFKIRASQAYTFKPNGKNHPLSAGTMTYLDKWVKDSVYGIDSSFTSKYTNKGISLENTAIDKAIEWLKLDFNVKNTERKEDEFFTGECDLPYPKVIIDTKVSWDHNTFPLFNSTPPDPANEWQVQVYMHLWKIENAKVVYVLLNTPDEIEPWKPKHNYDHIDPKFRIKSFDVKYDPAIINELIYKVKESRKYIDEKLEYLKKKL